MELELNEDNILDIAELLGINSKPFALKLFQSFRHCDLILSEKNHKECLLDITFKITFKELLTGIYIMKQGTKLQKAKLVFNFVDQRRIQSISKEELQNLLTLTRNMYIPDDPTKPKNQEKIQKIENRIQDYVESLWIKIQTKKSESHITFETFYKWLQRLEDQDH